MASLIFNQLYRIRTGTSPGIWRAICSLPDKEESILIRLPIDIDLAGAGPKKIDAKKMRLETRRITFEQTAFLLRNGDMESVTIHFGRNLDHENENASEAERIGYEIRRTVMAEFCNPAKLTENFESCDKFGNLVSIAEAVDIRHINSVPDSGDSPRTHVGVTKPAIYGWLKLLCIYGFNVSSLNLQFSNCGAPGTPREYKSQESKPGLKTLGKRLNVETHPQKAVRLVDRDIILSKLRAFLNQTTGFSGAYKKLVLDLWVTEWKLEGDKIIPVLPEIGTYPSKSQVQHLYDEHITKLQRLEKSVSQLTFARSYRGLGGYARDGVAGPGHVSAMDSTRADTDLRSSVNRNWLVGRPFVYWIVDVWSTAIVGFYVSLNHPSWQTARIALFCSVYGSNELTDIWGIPMDLGLSPYPTLSKSFLVDRGEYLSQGALLTAEDMSFNLEFNPAYRADLKGIIEVFNRIQKDDAYGLIPGAMDARKQAYESRNNKKMSAMVLREFVQYLQLFARHKNMTANREHLCTDEMKSQGVTPTPAGLWKFGHDIGIGFQSSHNQDALVKKLLSPLDMTVNRSGLEHGRLRYLSDEIDIKQWSGEARNFGAIPVKGFHIPSAPRQIWVNLPQDKLRKYALAPNSAMSADSSLLEHYDALAYSSLSKKSREHEKLQADLIYLSKAMEMSKSARLAVKNETPPPFSLNTHEARAVEMRAEVPVGANTGDATANDHLIGNPVSVEIADIENRSATDDLIYRLVLNESRA